MSGWTDSVDRARSMIDGQLSDKGIVGERIGGAAERAVEPRRTFVSLGLVADGHRLAGRIQCLGACSLTERCRRLTCISPPTRNSR